MRRVRAALRAPGAARGRGRPRVPAGRSPRRGAAASFLAAALAAACFAPGRAPLRVAVNPWPGYEFLFLARDLGLFERHGVDVELVETYSTADSARALARGLVDVACATNAEAVLAAAEPGGEPVRVFYAIDLSLGSDVLLARPGVRTLAELRGARIGVEPGSLDVVNVHSALRLAGLRLADVVLVPVAQAEKAESFARGELDAVQTYPPVAQRILAAGHVHVLYSSANLPGSIVDVFLAREAVLRQRAAELVALVRAFDEAIERWERAPELHEPRMAAREGLARGEFRTAMAGLRMIRLAEQAAYVDPGGALGRTLAETVEALAASGIAAPRRPLGSLLDASIARRALGPGEGRLARLREREP